METDWHNDQSSLMSLFDNSDKLRDLKSSEVDVQSTDLSDELNLKNIEKDKIFDKNILKNTRKIPLAKNMGSLKFLISV